MFLKSEYFKETSVPKLLSRNSCPETPVPCAKYGHPGGHPSGEICSVLEHMCKNTRAKYGGFYISFLETHVPTPVPKLLSPNPCPQTLVPKRFPETPVPKLLSRNSCPESPVPKLLSPNSCPQTLVTFSSKVSVQSAKVPLVRFGHETSSFIITLHKQNDF
jgi:hypothetical protein